MNHHYTVSLRVKPYVKKFIATIEGDPIRYDSKSMLCMIIRAYLQNSDRTGLSKDQTTTNLLSRTGKIDILIPATPKNKSIIGLELKAGHNVLINRYLEDVFERTLKDFIRQHVKAEGRYKGYKEAYFAFAEYFNITLDEDISYEGLKRIDGRARRLNCEKKIDNYFFTLVPSREAVA